MRSHFLSLVLGIAALGMLGAVPATADAHHDGVYVESHRGEHWRGGSRYVRKGGLYAYPGTSRFYGPPNEPYNCYGPGVKVYAGPVGVCVPGRIIYPR